VRLPSLTLKYSRISLIFLSKSSRISLISYRLHPFCSFLLSLWCPHFCSRSAHLFARHPSRGSCSSRRPEGRPTYQTNPERCALYIHAIPARDWSMNCDLRRMNKWAGRTAVKQSSRSARFKVRFLSFSSHFLSFLAQFLSHLLISSHFLSFPSPFSQEDDEREAEILVRPFGHFCSLLAQNGSNLAHSLLTVSSLSAPFCSLQAHFRSLLAQFSPFQLTVCSLLFAHRSIIEWKSKRSWRTQCTPRSR